MKSVMRSTWRLHVALKVWAVYQALEVAAPAVLGMQTFPICTDWSKDSFVPDYFPVQEEVQVHRAPLEMDGVHGLAATRFKVDSLLFWSTGKFPTGNHKTLLRGVANQVANVQ